MRMDPPFGFALGANKGKVLTSYFVGTNSAMMSYSSTLTGRTNVKNATPDIAFEEAKIALLQAADNLPRFGPANTYLGQYARENFSKVSKISVGGHLHTTFMIAKVYGELEEDLRNESPIIKGQSPVASSLLRPERLELIREYFPLAVK